MLWRAGEPDAASMGGGGGKGSPLSRCTSERIGSMRAGSGKGGTRDGEFNHAWDLFEEGTGLVNMMMVLYHSDVLHDVEKK